MSLLSIIADATQALANAQSQIGVVSTNIGNASNQSYARRDATTDASNGSTVVNVSRAVDLSLQQGVFSQTADSTGAAYLDGVYQQLESLTGSASGSPTLSGDVQSLLSAFQDCQTDPGSPAIQTEVVQAAQSLVQDVHAISAGIDGATAQVQGDAGSDVALLNTDLSAVAGLNAQIVAGRTAGKSVADLEDQRDQLMGEVSGLVQVSTRVEADGSLTVATPDGVGLVSGATAQSFAFNPYVPGANGTGGTNASISVAGDASVAVTASFTTGKIAAELGILRVDPAAVASTAPGSAPLEKLRLQLNTLVDQFYSPTTPTSFQQAYDGAASTQSTDLASGLFSFASGSGSDAANFQLDPGLVGGTATFKASAATALVKAMTQNCAAAPLSSGDISSFTGSISDLTDAIASAQSQRAGLADSASTQSATMLAASKTTYANKTGVSMDEQLSQLVVLQNSYNAAAKVISVSNTLAQSLISLIQ